MNLIHPAVSAVLFVLSVVVIWSLAPVEAENNPWEDTEKFIYRRKSRVILGIEIIAFVITLIFTKKWVSETIALGVLTECLMLLMGAVKNHYNNDKI